MPCNPLWIKAAATRLPSSARLLNKLHIALEQPDVDIDEVIRLVSTDIPMSTRLLRMANSASYSRGEAVTSLEQAFSWLGVYQAYRVACITVSAQLCEQSLIIYNVSADRLLANSIGMAVGMEVLSKKVGLDPKTGYTIGLLQHLGRVLLQRVAVQLPIRPGAADLPDLKAVMAWEQTTFGCNHVDAGNSVLTLWGMNPLFGKVLSHQYDPAQAEDPTIRTWCALMNLATPLVTNTDFGLGLTSSLWPITDAMLEDAGLSGMKIEDLSEEITEATASLCEKSGLSVKTSSSR